MVPALLCVALGLGLAGAAWRLPYIQRLELAEGDELAPDDGPEPTHTPRTGEFDAVAMPGPGEPSLPDDHSEAPTTVAPTEDGPRMSSHRRTKIVATIGPATRSVEGMIELIEAGADVFRLNFSHGTRDDHAENVAMAREAARAQPARRSGSSATCRARSCGSATSRAASSTSEPGARSTLTTERRASAPTSGCSVSWDGLPEAVTAATG